MSEKIEIRPPSAAFLAALPHLMELADLPGIACGVVRAGSLVWTHDAGVANANSKTPIDACSLFPGCSLGKPLFACVVLRLAQEGRIDLDRPLNLYLQEDALTGEFGDHVTARHVLSHTTGLYNWRSEREQRLTPTFAPGTRFRYSGEGFYHLQLVVEKITGIGFESMMQERMFRPLGMRSSTFLWNGAAKKHLVAGHRDDGPIYIRTLALKIADIMQASDKPLSYWTGDAITAALIAQGNPAPDTSDMVPNVAGSLLTTVEDYARFLTAYLDPQNEVIGLSANTRRCMQTPAIGINSALGWGLGIGVEQVDGQSFLWQWGDNGGWKNFLLMQPRARAGVIVFTNGRNGMHVIERMLHTTTRIDHPAFLWI